MSGAAKAELEAINQIHALLEPFDVESQKRVLGHVLGLLGFTTTRLRQRSELGGGGGGGGGGRRTRSTGKRKK